MKPRACGQAFTLIELLAAITVVSLLVVLLGTYAGKGLERAKSIQCLSRIKNLGSGILMFCQENNGEFPRSFHSAYPNGEPGWGKAILPYVGHDDPLSKSDWNTVFNKTYRCPSDPNTREWSYGLNVYFELDPDSDDYPGSPTTWRRLVAVPTPMRTVLLGELKTSSADHFMAHFWTAGAPEVDAGRHGERSAYVFADGHAEHLPLRTTFDPADNRNLWNPALAGDG